jgi:hypothetical protein
MSAHVLLSLAVNSKTERQVDSLPPLGLAPATFGMLSARPSPTPCIQCQSVEMTENKQQLKNIKDGRCRTVFLFKYITFFNFTVYFWPFVLNMEWQEIPLLNTIIVFPLKLIVCNDSTQRENGTVVYYLPCPRIR